MDFAKSAGPSTNKGESESAGVEPAFTGEKIHLSVNYSGKTLAKNLHSLSFCITTHPR